MTTNSNARQLLTTVTQDGRLALSIAPLQVEEPAADEVVVQVKATPINPSDLALLLGPADLRNARTETLEGCPALVADIRPEYEALLRSRVGKKLSAGNEGAGVVVAAGSSAQAQALLGKTVTMVGGKMYRTHRVIRAAEALPLPEGAAPSEGASLFVNPMTVQGFLNTMRSEGHSALVHTAAASNLGQMLAKLCQREKVPLVAIVRKESQRAILADLGVEHIVDSSKESFGRDLTDAIAATGATLGFDAIGGGSLSDEILTAMERALLKRGEKAGVYGVPVHKQVYVYGLLGTAPLELNLRYGMYWGAGGWLLTPHLQRVGMERTLEMRRLAIEERNGIFSSHYARTISLDGMTDPEIARKYHAQATGEKLLVDPSL